MPVQYRMAQKLMQAQRYAKEQGLSIVLYEGFRPRDAQIAVTRAVQQMVKADMDTRGSMTKGGFSLDFYIYTGVSSHQMGSAVDVSLAQVHSWHDISINGNIVSVPENFDEFSYGGILDNGPNGVSFSSASGHKFRPDLPDGNTSLWMPTPIHELSYLAGTFTGPTTTYTAEAWRKALNSGKVQRAKYWTEGAQTLQDIFLQAGMEPLASEWWHFNDLKARSTAFPFRSSSAY